MTEGNREGPGNKIQDRSGSEGTAGLEVKGCTRVTAVQGAPEFICSGLEHREGSRRKMEQI